MTEKNRFQDRVALVTGAGSDTGIGFAAAGILVKSGAKTVITATSDRIYTRLKELDAGDRAFSCIADLMNRDQVRELVKTVVSKYGRIDILVNNAGMTQTGRKDVYENMVDYPYEAWDISIDRNLNTCFNITKEVLPYMIKNNYGRIVNVSSVTGPIVSNPGQTGYSAGKSAMIGMSRSLAIEVAKYGITVNNVAPGWIASGATRDEEAIGAENTPMKRAGTPHEVGQLIAFLASDESTYITGQVFVIDGGNTIQEYKGPSELFY
ncbi:MAG: SDR family oxidoreductase [Desulfobacterales bacterium]|nr:SDR family oxidoreductase [Desulfobacterales bacterium]